MPTSSSNALKIFICHCSEDKSTARKLYQYLIKQGYDAWLDEEKLLAGQDWNLEIQKNLRNTDVVIVILSKKSIGKEGYVQKEIKFALDIVDEKPENTIFIIPLRLDDCEIPQRLKYLHTLDLSRKDSEKKLLDALDARAVSKGKNKHVESNNNFAFNNFPKSEPASQKPQKQKKESSANKERIANYLNLTGVRLVSVLSGLLAAITLRLLSEEYYRPDGSLLSTTAELIAKSDFTFAILILIAMAASGFSFHYIDSSHFESTKMPVWFRYTTALPIGYIIGAIADVLVAIAIPILLFIIGLGIIIFLMWLGSRSQGNYDGRVQTNGVNSKSEIPNFTEKNICKTCNGTGRSSRVCSFCHGTGKSRLVNIPCSICEGSGKQQCLVCNGTGKG